MGKCLLEIVLWVGILLSVSCNRTSKRVLSYQLIGDDTLYVCDMQSISNDEEVLKLSDLIDSFRIVRFENTDSAFFKTWKVYISDHYIGILNATSPFKLFDHSGNYICDIGGIGQAKGEYTMLYSGAIHEKDSAIWLAPFSGVYLWKYDMQGKCIASIRVQDMHKPVIRCETDNTLTATNLYFKGMPGFLHLRLFADDSIFYSVAGTKYAFTPRDENGNFNGYNHEVWFYNNVEKFVYMTTASDTLYTYNMQKDRTSPRFTIAPKTIDQYYTFNETPAYFLINVSGECRKHALVDKATGKASYVKIQNDFMGNLPVASFVPTNGWYYQMFEPIELIELIKATLLNKDMKTSDKMKLENFLLSIDENDNNILFMGRLSNRRLPFQDKWPTL